MGQMGLAVSLSFASGAMLYVNFGEILPGVERPVQREKHPHFFTVLGILLGNDVYAYTLMINRISA